MPRTMSDKQKRAINRGRVNAGLKPIKFKKTAKTLSSKKTTRQQRAFERSREFWQDSGTGRTRERFRDKWTKKKYVIIRIYRDPAKRSRIIKRNLTLAEAKKHTNDPKTRKAGVWFDGFDEQS